MRTCVGVEVLQVLQVCKFAFRFFSALTYKRTLKIKLIGGYN